MIGFNNKLTVKPNSYLEFIWKEKVNRSFLALAIGASVFLFIIFKILYPFPDFFSDSYYYLFSAYANLDVSIWPIGYSKFLALLHHFTYSDTVVVAIQYFIVQLASVHFFFTILRFFNTSNWTRKFLFAFLFINPLTLYLCNTINSDALFGGLSLIWVTELIWLIQRPRFYQVISNAILLFLCFTIRNNAYYYPLIGIIAFFLSCQNWKVKLIGMVFPFLFIIPFIAHSKSEAFKLTGSRQFSLFTGWQLANNALYIYDQIKVDSTSLPTSEAKQLNRIAIKFFSHLNTDDYRHDLESYVGNFFIKDSRAPLKQYFLSHYDLKDEMTVIRSWGNASAVFEPFGKAIILRHPFAYVQYFIWPNVWHYFMPPLSHLEKYNYGGDEVDPIAQLWFHYPSAKVHCISHQLQGFLIIYEALFFLFNLYFIWQLIQYTKNVRFILFKDSTSVAYCLATSFLVLNFIFSVSTTINILRYQIVPMIILLSFGLLISDHLEKIILLKRGLKGKTGVFQKDNQLSVNTGSQL